MTDNKGAKLVAITGQLEALIDEEHNAIFNRLVHAVAHAKRDGKLRSFVLVVEHDEGTSIFHSIPPEEWFHMIGALNSAAFELQHARADSFVRIEHPPDKPEKGS